MRWTCPKCGKILNISNEQLVANDGVVVCPQCLLQARQPVPTARVAARYDAADKATTPPPRKSSKTSTPPAHKNRPKQAKASYRYTGVGGSSSSTKKKSGKKKSKKKTSQGMSGWGCLGRTVVFTMVLFAAYVIFGLLLETFQ